MTATKAAARAEKTKAEKEEDAKWRTCPGCSPLQRRVIEVDGTLVMCAHRKYNGAYAMEPCPGSLMQPAQQETVPEAVFTE